MFWAARGEDRFDKELGAPYKLYKMRTKPPRTNGTRMVFSQWIRVYGHTERDEKTSPIEQRVWVRCSCEYFKFTLEVALASVGSSAIRYSNGLLPVFRNPGMKKFCCKHLWRAIGQVAELESARLKAEAAVQAPEGTVIPPPISRSMDSLDMRESEW